MSSATPRSCSHGRLAWMDSQPWRVNSNAPSIGNNGVSPCTAAEQTRLARSGQVEAGLVTSSVGGKMTTAFFGCIPEAATDEFILGLLEACGPVTKWKRVLDAANMPKSFGFCEFGSADALSRALSLLHDLPLLGGKRLIVKVDDSTLAYLKRYAEAMEKDQIAMSSKEADIAACEHVRTLLKEKNLYSAIEAIEKRLMLLTAEEPEEGEALSDDDPRLLMASDQASEQQDKRVDKNEAGRRRPGGRSPSRDRRDRRESRSSDHVQQQLRAYKERESRWESREAQMNQRHRRDQQALIEEKARQADELEYATKYLGTFDDFYWLVESLDKLLGITPSNRDSANASRGGSRLPDFYANRELWKSRRVRDRNREEEYDKRDEEAERRRQAEISVVPLDDDQPIKGEIGKRSRPTASEFIKVEEEEEEPEPTPEHEGKRRKPLIDKDYTKEELLRAGYDSQGALTKLKELYKEKVASLIERIPTDQTALFEWPVEWKYLDMRKTIALIKKKTGEQLTNMGRSLRDVERISQCLAAQIQQHSSPETIIAWLVEDKGLLSSRSTNEYAKQDSAVFVAILWRYLVYETEAAAHNLVPPE